MEQTDEAEILKIVGDIFYSPATNAQAEQSIANGFELIRTFVNKQVTLATTAHQSIIDGQKERIDELTEERDYYKKGLEDIANPESGSAESCRNMASNYLNHYI